MEWIEGVPLADPQRLSALGVRLRGALAPSSSPSCARRCATASFTHDQGNFFVDAEGRIVAVDFGIMGRLGIKERRFLAHPDGFIKRDYLKVAEVHFEAGYVPRVHRVEDSQAIRAIGEPIHSRTADQISMANPTLLFEITALRHDHARRVGDAAKGTWWSSRASRASRSAAQHVVDRGAGGRELGSPKSPGRAAFSTTSSGGWRRSPRTPRCGSGSTTSRATSGERATRLARDDRAPPARPVIGLIFQFVIAITLVWRLR